MKKTILILISILTSIFIIGCSNTKNLNNTKTKLVYEKLSQREEYLINLTGNRILTYKLENMPSNKKYELMLTYEVYENGKQIKSDNILGIIHDEATVENEDSTIGINIQEGKIRTLQGQDGYYATGQYELKEDLSMYCSAYLTTSVPLELGKEMYIYYATSNESIRTNIPLGVPIIASITNNIVAESRSTILIKLSFLEKN